MSTQPHPMNTQDLVELKASMKAAAEKATQGDWGMSGVRTSTPYAAHTVYAGVKQETIAHVFFNKLTGEGFSDAKFIGLCSPANVLALLSRIEALEAENEGLREERAWPSCLRCGSNEIYWKREPGHGPSCAVCMTPLRDPEPLAIDWQRRANQAEFLLALMAACAQASKAALAYVLDRAVYGDSYGVHGSDFEVCHFCQGGGAPGVAMEHGAHCPVARYPDVVAKWFDEMAESHTVADDAETQAAHYRKALKSTRGFLRLWIGDVECGITPTVASLQAAYDEVRSALSLPEGEEG